MQGEKAAAVFTDPPYNLPIDGNVSGLGAIRHREFVMGSGEMNEAEFTAFLTRACATLARHSDEGAIHFICMDWRHMGELLAAGREAYAELKNLCIWVKGNGGMGSFYRSEHELVFVFKHGRGSHRNNIQLGQYGRNRTNVWRYPCANSFSKSGDEGNLLALHPTVKVIAAERTGRRCYGIELDPLYVDTIIRRWQAFTGDQARHASSDRTFVELEAEVGKDHA